MSRELQRIAALPLENYSAAEWQVIESRIRRPGCAIELWIVQKRALLQIARLRGLNGYIGVGHGKSLIALLAGAVLGVQRSIVFTEGSERDGARAQLAKQYEETAKHFYLPSTRICSYGILSSRTQGTDLLSQEYQQHAGNIAIICDEAQNLAPNKNGHFSARTFRIEAFLREHPYIPFVDLGGTPFAETLTDNAHLAEYATREWSPLPFTDTFEHEALRVIFTHNGDPRPQHWNAFTSLCDINDGLAERKVKIAEFFRRRLHNIAGTITEFTEFSEVPLYLHEIEDVKVPDAVTDVQRRLEAGELIPTKEPQLNASSLARAMCYAETGFYYEWIWPGEPDLEWMFARRNWANIVQRELKANAAQGYDSESLIAQAVAQKLQTGKPANRLEQCYVEWSQQWHKPQPDVTAVWISNYLLEYAIALAKEHRAILWYTSRAVGTALARHIETINPGDGFDMSRNRPIALCRTSHGTGLNLQHAWSNMIYLESPVRPRAWQQSLARCHRPGQTKPCHAWVFTHSPYYVSKYRASLDLAQNIYIQTGEVQKLIQAERQKGLRIT